MPQLSIQEALERARDHQAAGRFREAEALLRQLLSIQPENPQALFLLGTLALQTRHYEDATKLLSRATQLAPDDFLAHSNLGAAFQFAGDLDAAIISQQRAVEINRSDAASRINLALALRGRGRFAEAIAAARSALSLAPNSSEALNTLGDALLASGDVFHAADAFRQALLAAPDDPVIHSNLGVAQQQLGEYDQAVQNLRRSIELKSDFPEAHNNLASALRDLGRVSESLKHYRRAVELNPGYVAAHDALLVSVQYVEDDPTTIAREHQRWQQQHTIPLGRQIPPHRNDRSLGRRLRIGYVSPDFREHPVSFFVQPLLAAHDPQQVEVFCYSDVSRPDVITSNFELLSHHWRNTYSLRDPALCDLIRADQIDLLVDLALHTGGNRLLAFARKPAPIQISYLGYCASPGLSTIDWRFTDSLLEPVRSWGPEKIWTLAGGFCAYQPPAHLPALSQAARGITFGSFNILAKVTDDTLELWSQILQQAPSARLLIQAKAADQPSVRERLTAFFTQRGVDAGRLILRPAQPLHDYLQTLAAVDICLDTYPFAGHTTTCHSLVLGVPVICRYGALPLSRVGLSLLSPLGLSDLAAANRNDYVDRAVALAQDPRRLNDLRRTLPERTRSSALMDASRLARQIEQAYRKMWQGWSQT